MYFASADKALAKYSPFFVTKTLSETKLKKFNEGDI